MADQYFDSLEETAHFVMMEFALMVVEEVEEATVYRQPLENKLAVVV